MLIAVVTALACELGLWWLRYNRQPVALIWPASGVALGLVHRFGAASLPWISLGHLVIWRSVDLDPATLMVTLIYPAEAWLAALLMKNPPSLLSQERHLLLRTAWRLLGVPWIAVVPS